MKKLSGDRRKIVAWLHSVPRSARSKYPAVFSKTPDGVRYMHTGGRWSRWPENVRDTADNLAFARQMAPSVAYRRGSNAKKKSAVKKSGTCIDAKGLRARRSRIKIRTRARRRQPSD